MSSSIPTFSFLILITFGLHANALDNFRNCVKDLSGTSAYSEDDLLSLSIQAVQALLDPKVPIELAKEFDYGISPETNIVQRKKLEGATLVPENEQPRFPSYVQFDPEEVLILSSPTLRPDSRLGFFKGHFFSSGFYARRMLAGIPKIEPLPSYILHNQPWIEKKGASYLVHDREAGKQILNLLSDTINLYRGTFPQEAELTKLMILLKTKSAVPDLTQKLESFSRKLNLTSHLANSFASLHKFDMSNNESRILFYNVLTQSLAKDLLSNGLGSGGLFVTTSKSKSFIFSKGSQIQYLIPKKVLLELYEKNILYVGVEDQIEINFLGPQAISTLFDYFASSEDRPPDGNIWSVGTGPHPLWNISH